MSEWDELTLPLDEIQGCLSDLQIDVTVKQLKDPRKGMVRTVYESLLHQMTGYSKGEAQPQFMAMNVFEYPELYEKAITNCEFTREL